MPIGITTDKNIGVDKLITKTTATTLKNIRIHILIVIGSTLSTTSTSLEKRFMTRPNGVVSKNDIGNLNVL